MNASAVLLAASLATITDGLNSLRWLLWAALVVTVLWWFVWGWLCVPEELDDEPTKPKPAPTPPEPAKIQETALPTPVTHPPSTTPPASLPKTLSATTAAAASLLPAPVLPLVAGPVLAEAREPQPAPEGDAAPLNIPAEQEAVAPETAAQPSRSTLAHIAPVLIDHAGIAAAHFTGEPVTVDPALGIVFSKKPAQIDDLERIRGVEGATEAKLYASGVYRFRQIAHWSDANVAAFAGKTGVPKAQIESHRWVPQAAELADLAAADSAAHFTAPVQVDHAAVAASSFAGEPITVDSHLGIVYTTAPEVKDHLGDIAGIDAGVAVKLGEAGIHRFEQVAHWSDHNVEAFAGRLGIPKSRIEEEKWVPQARRLHRDTYSASGVWGASHPSIADYEARIARDYAGESVTADAERGIVYESRPAQVDDLKLIKGIAEVYESRLNQAGVYRFRQIADWSEANVEAYAQACEAPVKRLYRDRWIPQAGGLVQFAGEPIRVDDDLGILYTAAPAEVDDLRKIKGVGPVIEKRLHEFGVYRYKQIAHWTASAVAAFSERLGTFKGRIHWDNWIGQTRRLHREKYGE